MRSHKYRDGRLETRCEKDSSSRAAANIVSDVSFSAHVPSWATHMVETCDPIWASSLCRTGLLRELGCGGERIPEEVRTTGEVHVYGRQPIRTRIGGRARAVMNDWSCAHVLMRTRPFLDQSFVL